MSGVNHQALSEMVERQLVLLGERVALLEQVVDEECVGVMVAQYFELDGAAVLRVAVEALEEANFHTEAAKVRELLDAEVAS